MSDELLRDEAITLLLAGHETTALALSWAWFLLGQHPEAEARMAAEIADVLGDRPATTHDLPHLKYTESVVMESMRIYPPAWAMGRESIGPFQATALDGQSRTRVAALRLYAFRRRTTRLHWAAFRYD
jgi:cytochrome P450